MNGVREMRVFLYLRSQRNGLLANFICYSLSGVRWEWFYTICKCLRGRTSGRTSGRALSTVV